MSVEVQSKLCFIVELGCLYSGVEVYKCDPWRMVSSMAAAPQRFVILPRLKSVVSFQPVENWRSSVLMRGLVASVASVRDAAELTVETMGADRQSSASVTIFQVFKADSSTD